MYLLNTFHVLAAFRFSLSLESHARINERYNWLRVFSRSLVFSRSPRTQINSGKHEVVSKNDQSVSNRFRRRSHAFVPLPSPVTPLIYSHRRGIHLYLHVPTHKCTCIRAAKKDVCSLFIYIYVSRVFPLKTLRTIGSMLHVFFFFFL